METTPIIKTIKHKSKVDPVYPGGRDILKFELLYDECAPALYSWILTKTNDTAIAEEILVNSFIAMWKNIHLYDPSKCKFFIWMLQLTVKEIMQHPGIQKN